MIPLPIDLGDGRLVWQRKPWQTVRVDPCGGGVTATWQDGSDAGTLYTAYPGRVLDVLRSIYYPRPRAFP